MTLWETLVGVTVILAVILMAFYALPLLLLPIAVLAWVWCAEWYQERKAENSNPSRDERP